METIGVPTLILHRTDDRSLPVEGARFLAERIRGARLVELPGADHLPFVGDQDAILDEIEEFLTGVRRGAETDRVLATVLSRTSSGPRSERSNSAIASGVTCWTATTSSSVASSSAGARRR